MKFSFLCALPRTGATLLGAIINQSKQIKMTPNSILPEVFLNLFNTKESSVFKNFPYHTGIDNIILNVFNNYYKDIKADHILDKGPWGTPYHLEILKSMFKERRFVILVRPVLECLASFIKAKRDKHIIITYEDFVTHPQKELNRIFRFLKLKPEKLDLNNLKQYTFDGMSYDDKNVEGPFHSIDVDKVKQINYKVEDYLPKKIIDRYKNARFIL